MPLRVDQRTTLIRATLSLGLAILSTNLAWCASSVAPAASLGGEVARVGAVLARAPYLVPEVVLGPLVGVPYTIDHGGGVSLGVPHRVWGVDAQIERHRADRLNRPPRFWALVLDDRHRVRYWTPLGDTRTVRVETPADRGGGRIDAAAFRLNVAVGIVRVPFVPGGELVVIPGTGRSHAPIVPSAGRVFAKDLP